MKRCVLLASLLLAMSLPAAAGPEPDDKKSTDERRTFGVRRGEDATLPLLYVIPMKGQMGTDINADVYREMLADIRAVAPDRLIIEIESRDSEERTVNRVKPEDRGLHSSTFLDMYREIVHVFHDDLRDIPQSVWIRDSQGVSSIVALSWGSIYMQPGARLGGLGRVAVNFLAVQGDANMFGKFREAYMAWLRGFAEYGDLDTVVVDAMVIPGKKLSATWKGRRVEWKLSDEGEYLVDGSDGSTVSFNAKTAEDFILSDGTAESLDDLALMLGFREYRLAQGKAESIFEGHREGWRRSLDQCTEWFRDYEQYLGWANGDETLKYLGMAKGTLEKVLRAMERYKAVEVRLLMDGVDKFSLVTEIEVLKERIRALQQGGGGGNRGGGNSRGGGMGGG
jgi:hypothetical protein